MNPRTNPNASPLLLGCLGVIVCLVGIGLLLAQVYSVLSAHPTSAYNAGYQLGQAFIPMALTIGITAALAVVMFRYAFNLHESGKEIDLPRSGVNNMPRPLYDAETIWGYTVGGGGTTYHVAICFDPDGRDPQVMNPIVAGMLSSGWYQWVLGGTPFVPDRRLAVPMEITGGRVVYMADILAANAFVMRPIVAVVAERGPSGRIVLADAM